MVQDEGHLGQSPDRRDHITELHLPDVQVDSEAASCDPPHPFAVVRIQKSMRVGFDISTIQQDSHVPDPPQPLRCGSLVRIENTVKGITQTYIDSGDNRGGDTCPYTLSFGFLPHRVGELRLTDGAKFHGTFRPPAGLCLDEHGCLDIVATGDVGGQVIEEVLITHQGDTLVPQVVVRVNDGQVGLENVFDQIRQCWTP
jgi:hypothetical protein